MKRILRLIVLISSGIFASVLAIYFANYLIIEYSITDITPKATIIGGILTLLGTIFSAVYKELSSYYQSKSDNASKKWELILPFIKKHYNPWINSAKSLTDAIKRISSSSVNDDQVNRVLYLTAVFYGHRLRFILEDGGLILLSTTSEEKKVDDAYQEIKDAFQWSETNTPNRVSELQKLFYSKNKQGQSYVLSDFIKDVESSTTLKESRTTMKEWLKTEGNRTHLETKLNKFVDNFKTAINKLYTDWE